MNSRLERVFSRYAPLAYEIGSKITAVGNQRVVAILTDYRGRLISVGWNKHKTHPIMQENSYEPNPKIYLHAEADCLCHCKHWRHYPNLSSCSLLVYRIMKKQAKFGLAKPCLICQSLIDKHLIWNVRHT